MSVMWLTRRMPHLQYAYCQILCIELILHDLQGLVSRFHIQYPTIL